MNRPSDSTAPQAPDQPVGPDPGGDSSLGGDDDRARGAAVVSRNRGARVNRFLLVLALGFIVVYAAFFLFRAAQVVAFPYPLNYGEGAVLATAGALAGGTPLYRAPSDPPFLSANYGPLYYLALTPFAGPAGFAAGRLLSVIAALVIAIGLWDLVRRSDRWTALLLGGLWLALLPVYAWAGVAKPDLPALALALGGLLMARRHPLLSGALLAAAVLTKASALTAVAAVGIAALLPGPVWPRRVTERRTLGVALILLMAAVFAGELASGGWLLRRTVLLNLSGWSGDQWQQATANAARLFWPVLLASVWAAWWRVRRGEWDRWLTYWLIALVVAVAGIGKIGADLNYYLEPLLATLTLVAVVLRRPATEEPSGQPIPGGSLVARAGLVLAISQLALSAHIPGSFEPLRTPGSSDRQQAASLVAAIREIPGAWLAEESGWLIAAGQPVWLDDPFYFAVLHRAGLWDAAPVVRALSDREVTGVLLDFDPFADPRNFGFHADRFPPEVFAALRDGYRPDRSIFGRTILIPANPVSH